MFLSHVKTRHSYGFPLCFHHELLMSFLTVFKTLGCASCFRSDIPRAGSSSSDYKNESLNTLIREESLKLNVFLRRKNLKKKVACLYHIYKHDTFMIFLCISFINYS